ncbi:MAG: bifunctional nuclease family protein [Bacteroidales bacterium]|nr:bifunctional nuclease family protein [Bacteroidales bacterium]NPV35168.1 bifunctional nuclease family protein [Bacteroidales bacterium]
MDKIRMEIVGMSYSQLQNGAYALILGEVDGKRRLPIVIGSFEAQAIAIALEKMKPARPLTHDLFKSFAETFGVTLLEVVINKFIEGVFHAVLVCDDGHNVVEIDSRTSDAVALALRFNCPIYTTEAILKAAGVEMDAEALEEEDEDNPQNENNPWASYTDEELEEMMKKAIEDEEYEKASQIRDELKRRK